MRFLVGDKHVGWIEEGGHRAAHDEQVLEKPTKARGELETGGSQELGRLRLVVCGGAERCHLGGPMLAKIGQHGVGCLVRALGLGLEIQVNLQGARAH